MNLINSKNTISMIENLKKGASENYRNAIDNYILICSKDELKSIIIRDDVIKCSKCNPNAIEDLVYWIAKEGYPWTSEFIEDNKDNATAMAMLDKHLVGIYYNKISNLLLNI